MGLRIIDRIRPKPTLTNDEVLHRQGLEWEAARTFVALAGNDASEDHFLAKLHAAHERVLDPEEMLERAIEIRTVLRLQTHPCPVHAKIDIATLIELL